MSMFNFFNKPGAKANPAEKPDAAQTQKTEAQQTDTSAQPVAVHEGYSPIAPNINTNPEPQEMASEAGEAEGYWDEAGNFIYYGSEQDIYGYYDENGEYVYYDELDPQEAQTAQYAPDTQEESDEGYWDEAGNFIYYGSEQDVYGYYDENGEYVYYAEGENYDGGAYAGEAAYADGGAQTVYEEPTAEVEPQKEKSYSVIADETTVMGNIKTTGHIDIIGEVLGNVDAGGNVAVLGSISGNVASEKMGLENCRINGNLKASIGIIASATSTIIGNVRTKNLLLDGKLKGNINADNVVVFRKNAYFLGDVQAGQIAIEMGAIFNGNIKMITGGDPDAPFYEAL